MTIQSRETLKDYFSVGSMPTQQHFVDLIDSALNLKDEGFDKNVKDGEVIQALSDDEAPLFSFFRAHLPERPQWRVSLGKGNPLLFDAPLGSAATPPRVDGGSVAGRPDQPLLCLTQGRRIGIGTDDPREALDVRGHVAMAGRRGSLAPPMPVEANGIWQPITDKLTGIHGFEVVARVWGEEGSGRYALLHAVALSAWNPRPSWIEWLLGRRRGIRVTVSWWGRRCNRLQLRWSRDSGKDAKYQLEIRTACKFDGKAQVAVQLTRLWQESAAPAAPEVLL